MAANQFQQGVFDALDSRRRAFLWDGTPSTIGAHCPVAWTKVCDSKEAGGMGIRDLQLQNQCLLLKLVHRLHHPEDSAWTHWARRGLHLASLTGPYAVRAHWDALRKLLPFYQSITSVSIGDGCSTSFWNDLWLGEVPLDFCLPLWSYQTKANLSQRHM
jgi:hypothetical protein